MVVKLDAVIEVITSEVPKTAAIISAVSIPSVAIDILQDHDGVVHHHADAHCNAAQTHHIQRCAKNIHQRNTVSTQNGMESEMVTVAPARRRKSKTTSAESATPITMFWMALLATCMI